MIGSGFIVQAIIMLLVIWSYIPTPSRLMSASTNLFSAERTVDSGKSGNFSAISCKRNDPNFTKP